MSHIIRRIVYQRVLAAHMRSSPQQPNCVPWLEKENLSDDATAAIGTGAWQKVQRTIHISLDALFAWDKLVKRLPFTFTVLRPKIMGDFKNRSGRRSSFLDLCCSRLGTFLCLWAGSDNIGVSDQHLRNLTGSLLTLDRLARRVSRLQHSRQHGFEGLNSIFGRHGIRNVLGSTFGIIHGREDHVRSNLQCQSDSRWEGKNLGVSFSSLGSGTRKVTVSLGGSVELENTVGVLSIFALLFNNVGHKF
mmetsp:Transcript_19526/g.42083  ORF Transcript_19526/g.42083 Transcript_19526/m.42083 type:complete len:247 (-) Transcript_19526:1030-1770(-)